MLEQQTTKSESITTGTNEERDQLTESVPVNAATRIGITIFVFFLEKIINLASK